MGGDEDIPADKKRMFPGRCRAEDRYDNGRTRFHSDFSGGNVGTSTIQPRRRAAQNAIIMTKEEVYKQIVRYLNVEGYLLDPNMEANINDLFFSIISPIIDDFKRRTGRNKISLLREKQIVSEDNHYGGYREFVVVDKILVTETTYILIIEAKQASLGAAMGQCLLAMKDSWDSNHEGILYGFVTTGESWRMLRYNGASFLITDKMDAVFDTMGRRKERWMESYSHLVDCIYAALCDGGIAKKDAVVG
ncbi:hypothetical protein BDZ91DRAFT_726081 [Kalaharituber pfeilii]|nr:hypothetical protein BDZ91DRAFT_726081 [Kalaharituber pfeilii]